VDEFPQAYKSIYSTIVGQSDLEDVIGEFMPRLGCMAAPAKEY
jgi:hypothetical protein